MPLSLIVYLQVLLLLISIKGQVTRRLKTEHSHNNASATSTKHRDKPRRSHDENITGCIVHSLQRHNTTTNSFSGPESRRTQVSPPGEPRWAGTRSVKRAITHCLHFHHQYQYNYQLHPFFYGLVHQTYTNANIRSLSTTSFQVFLGLPLDWVPSTS